MKNKESVAITKTSMADAMCLVQCLQNFATVTLHDKIAYEKEKERISSFINKQKSTISNLKISTPLIKPKKLVLLMLE